MQATTIDREAFIDGYIECALWADCMPAEPTDEELAEFAWEHGATDDYIADADTDKLSADYGDRWRDTAESGGRESLELRDGVRESMSVDCLAFCEANASDLAMFCSEHGYTSRAGYNASECAGHDFWLTRNGHGAGYWDRGLGALGERLSDAARAYGEANAPWDCGDGTADVDENYYPA
jgi:hypothetical protein